MQAEKDVRLRIELLKGQSNSIAETLAKAIKERDELAFAEYSEKLVNIRSRIEELMWVLGEKEVPSILNSKVTSSMNEKLTVGEIIEKLKSGDLKLGDLAPEVQQLVRKGALELKNK